MEDSQKKRKAGASPKGDNGQKIRPNRRQKKQQKYLNQDDEDLDDRGRTPSGTNLAGNVKDLRYFFSSNSNKITEEQQTGQVNQPLKDQSTETKSIKASDVVDHDNHGSAKHDTNNNNQAVNSDHQVNNNRRVSVDTTSEEEGDGYHTPRLENSVIEDLEDKETKFIYQLSKVIKFATKEQIDQQIEDVKERRKQFKMERSHSVPSVASITGNQVADMVSPIEQNDSENPQTLGVSSVIEMMRKFKEEIVQEIAKNRTEDRAALEKHLQQEIGKVQKDNIENIKSNVACAIAEDEKVRDMEADLAFYKMKSESLMEVCNRMSMEINDLATRMDNLEVSASKKMLLVTGLRLFQSAKKRDTLSFLNDFICANLGLQVTVDDFFTLGTWEPKPVVLIMQTIEDKRQILYNKKLLKGYQTMEGKSVYINDYFPPIQNEKRRREQDITSHKREEGKIKAVSYIKGQLAIDGDIYNKAIIPPTPKELVDVTPEQMDEILQFKTVRGDSFTSQNSFFLGYAAKTQSFDDINMAYRKIKMLKPDARHVVCAYSLQDQTLPYHIANDYQDDGEPGAGRILLGILQAKNMSNTAIFVARKFGGIRMGAERFDQYGKAAKSALGVDPQEQIIVKKQVRQNKQNPWRPKTHQPHKQTKGQSARSPVTGSPYVNPYQIQHGNPRMANPPAIRQPVSQHQHPPHMQINMSQIRQPASFYQHIPHTQLTPAQTQAYQPIYNQQFPPLSAPAIRQTAPYNPPVHYVGPAATTMKKPYDAVVQENQNNSQEDERSSQINDSMEYSFSEPEKIVGSENEQDNQNQEQWSNENEGQWEDTDVKTVD